MLQCLSVMISRFWKRKRENVIQPMKMEAAQPSPKHSVAMGKPAGVQIVGTGMETRRMGMSGFILPLHLRDSFRARCDSMSEIFCETHQVMLQNVSEPSSPAFTLEAWTCAELFTKLLHPSYSKLQSKLEPCPPVLSSDFCVVPCLCRSTPGDGGEDGRGQFDPSWIPMGLRIKLKEDGDLSVSEVSDQVTPDTLFLNSYR